MTFKMLIVLTAKCLTPTVLNIEDNSILARLAQNYLPVKRAILGALLEELGASSLISALKKSLNPITQYKFLGINKTLSNTEIWNIE